MKCFYCILRFTVAVGGVTSTINYPLNPHAVNSSCRFPKAALLKVAEQRAVEHSEGSEGKEEARNKKSRKGEGGKTGKQKRKETQKVK